MPYMTLLCSWVLIERSSSSYRVPVCLFWGAFWLLGKRKRRDKHGIGGIFAFCGAAGMKNPAIYLYRRI